jgi:alpha-mannosidase
LEEKQIIDFEIEGDLEAQERLKNAGHSISGRATVHVIAQSHLDLMWKWDRHDIREMIYSLFSGHAALLEANPEYTYAQSQIFLYEYVRRHFPELFARVADLVKQGRWEIVGGQWVEADGNLLDDESTVRQYLLGQRYVREHFGVTVRTGWCPDGFGLPRSLPQVMSKAGLTFFVHKRPRHRFLPLPATPYRLEGLDGSRLCALRSNNKGIGLPRVSEGEPFEGTEIEYLYNSNAALGITDLWGPLGCGDTGGVNDYGEVPRANHANLDFVFSTPQQFYQKIARYEPTLPVVRDELNFEFPACYTTHTDIKQGNRRCERLLNLAEFLCTLAYGQGGMYPTQALDEAWKLVLYNQFHDGVTGTGLDRVHEESLRDYAHVQYLLGQAIEDAALFLEGKIDTGVCDRPVVVFNPNCFTVNTAISINVTLSKPGKRFALRDSLGVQTACAVVSDELLDGNGNYHRLSLLGTAPGLPPCGWKAFDLVQTEDGSAKQDFGVSSQQLESEFYQLKLDGAGDIISVLDKQLNKQVNQPGQAFAELQVLCEGEYVLDYGRPHKAWNFGFNGQRKVVEFTGAEVIECNAVRTVLRQRFAFGQSTVQRDIILYAVQKKLEFRLELDWQEVETYLGVAFPLNMEPEAKLSYRVPFALDNRPGSTGERPSLNYVLKQDESTGFALMTRDRYGFSEPQPNVLRLSVIRCSTDYVNRSDSGMYVFEFAVSSGCAEEASGLIRLCEEYRRPPLVHLTFPHSGGLAVHACAVAAEDGRILVSAMKKSEQVEGFVLRLFNDTDDTVQTRVNINQTLLPFERAFEANLLEDAERELPTDGGSLPLTFGRHEIKTVLLKGRQDE